MSKQNPWKFDIKTAKVLKAMKDAMYVAATESENHFKKSFRTQGFEDETVEKWQPRKRPSRADKRNPRQNRAILVQSGALRRSILRTRVNAYRYKIESDLPYSAIHNYGLIGRAWGKHSFKMPQRRYMGASRALMRRNINTIKRFVTAALISK